LTYTSTYTGAIYYNWMGYKSATSRKDTNTSKEAINYSLRIEGNSHNNLMGLPESSKSWAWD